MLGRLFSKIGGALRKIDSAAEKILAALQRLYTRLARKLDGALEKLDEATKALLRKYYRALNYLEKLFGILRKLLRVIFPILLLFAPPAFGFVIIFLAYDTYFLDSIVLGCMCVVLLLVLVASFRSKDETTGANPEDQEVQTPLAITSELDNLGIQRKIAGAAVALVALALSAYLSPGFLIGILLFIAEVVVLYILKWMYGTGERANNAIAA
jgi:Ca2+/Na+ antiporter